MPLNCVKVGFAVTVEIVEIAPVELAEFPAVILIPPAPEAVILLPKTTPPTPAILTVKAPLASVIKPLSFITAFELIVN